MPRRGICLCSALCLTLAVGCKSKDGKADEAVAGQSKLTEQEDSLLSRRDALLNSRIELRQKKAELDEQRKAIQSQGGDTTEIDKQADALSSEESDLVSQEKDLNGKLDQILNERRALVTQLAGGGDTAGREAGVAAREKDLARREARLAEREAALSTREDGLARKWKDSCGAGGTTTIVQTIDAKGSKYTKKDVEPLLAKAREEMSRKGLMSFDLPDPVRGLEKEANDAIAAGDFGRARLAANQLLGTVRSMKVDKGFIAAKIARLNAVVKGKKLSSAVQADVDSLFRDATANYGDGRFGEANGKLNKIYGKVD